MTQSVGCLPADLLYSLVALLAYSLVALLAYSLVALRGLLTSILTSSSDSMRGRLLAYYWPLTYTYSTHC